MKKLLTFSLVILASTFWLSAQISVPAASPGAKVTQSVGLTEVTVEYSRPSVKDREIFGALVPMDKMWRTGANASTKVEFSNDVKFGGQDVPAGKYALYMQPGKSDWTVVLYKDLSHWGTPSEWDDSQEAARFTATATEMNTGTESMHIWMDNLRNTSADMMLDWANVRVTMPIEVSNDKQVMASIDKTLAGPTSGDYYRAAGYYADSGQDLDKALEWINKADEMRPDAYWINSVKAQILAKKGDKKEAIATATKAAELAKKAGNDGMALANEALIKELK